MNRFSPLDFSHICYDSSRPYIPGEDQKASLEEAERTKQVAAVHRLAQAYASDHPPPHPYMEEPKLAPSQLSTHATPLNGTRLSQYSIPWSKLSDFYPAVEEANQRRRDLHQRSLHYAGTGQTWRESHLHGPSYNVLWEARLQAYKEWEQKEKEDIQRKREAAWNARPHYAKKAVGQNVIAHQSINSSRLLQEIKNGNNSNESVQSEEKTQPLYPDAHPLSSFSNSTVLPSSLTTTLPSESTSTSYVESADVGPVGVTTYSFQPTYANSIPARSHHSFLTSSYTSEYQTNFSDALKYDRAKDHPLALQAPIKILTGVGAVQGAALHATQMQQKKENKPRVNPWYMSQSF